MPPKKQEATEPTEPTTENVAPYEGVDERVAPGRAPSGNSDLLGFLDPAGGTASPLKPLYEGSANIAEWGPRGHRSQEVAHAEVVLTAENLALKSENFMIRGPMMKRVVNAEPLRQMFRGKRQGMTKLEFGALVVMAAVIFGTFFLMSQVMVE